jgi:hypothetical protein
MPKKTKELKQKREEKDKKKSAGGLFIPAGILLGFGFGFAFNNVPAGMFIGLGAGFLAFALYEIFRKK